MKDKIIASFEKYMNESSQWNFKRGLKLYLNTIKVSPLKGSSYIKLQKKLKNKKALINPKNKEDQKCFLWCMAIHKLIKENPNKKHPEKITRELVIKSEIFNTNGMKFPCTFLDINKFENNNNIAVNVFGYDNEKEEILPLRITLKINKELVRILLIEENGQKHYCLIKNMSKLFSKQYNNHGHTIYPCDYCMQVFVKQELLDEHLQYCKQHECVKNSTKIFTL